MKRVFIAIAVAFGLLLHTQNADALFKVRITDLSTATSVTVTDNGAGDTLPLITGFISTSGTLGSFTYAVNGTSKPLGANTAFSAQTDLSVLTVTNTGLVGATIRIELTDTGFSINPEPVIHNSKIGGTATPALSAVVISKQSVDFGNVEFATPALTTITHAPPPLTGAFSDDKSANYAYAGGLFSITEFEEITLAPAGSVSFDHLSTVVNPAPPSWLLAASGALGAVGYRIRRRKAVA